MGGRPYVVASCAMSIDGYVDDASGQRLVLSNAADLDRVDEVRASVDAILVGAGTIRRDNPRLMVRPGPRRAARVATGQPASPIKVTLTGTGALDPAAEFFTMGDVEKLVYAATLAVPVARERLGDVAAVVDAGDPASLTTVLADLADRGVRRLLVEGGGRVHTQLLTGRLVDELHLSIAPFFVGDPAAPRFVDGGAFPHDAAHGMRLAQVTPLGDVVFLRYLLGDA